MPSTTATLSRLTLARRAAGYQQQELARLAVVSAARLCEYEHGAHPPAETQAALARILGHSVEALFPNNPELSAACIREWLASSSNDEGPAGRPSPVTSAVRGQHDEE